MDLAPEVRLFCLAVRRPQHSRDLEALHHTLAAVPDWGALMRGVQRHRVAPLFLNGLKAVNSTLVPAAVRAELRGQTLAAARRSLRQIAELGRISHVFAEAGIRALALKGAVLSAQLYGDATLRSARDIDFLIDPDQYTRAES